jgi:hypothetical protein
MKQLLLICVIIASFAPLRSQDVRQNPSNTVYVSFSPVDLGVGLRYDRQFNNTGVYTALSYGNYDFPGGYIDDHVKIALGGISYLNNAFFTFGGSYHYYGKHKIPEGMSVRTLKTLSYELGVGNMFGNVQVAFRMDIYKWESMLEIGIKF